MDGGTQRWLTQTVFRKGDVDEDGPPTWDTPLAFRPSRKEEVWRWFSYALVHAGWARGWDRLGRKRGFADRVHSCTLVAGSWLHLFVNMIIQLIFGIPLELAHSWWRVGQRGAPSAHADLGGGC